EAVEVGLAQQRVGASDHAAIELPFADQIGREPEALDHAGGSVAEHSRVLRERVAEQCTQASEQLGVVELAQRVSAMLLGQLPDQADVGPELALAQGSSGEVEQPLALARAQAWIGGDP